MTPEEEKDKARADSPSIPELFRSIESTERELEREQNPKPGLTDLGNAERMCKRYGAKLHYAKKSHQWFVWDGRLWNPNAEDLLNKFAARVVKAIYWEAADEADREAKQRIFRHAVNSEADSKIEAMLRRLRWLDDSVRGVNIPVDNSVFNPEPGLFNCRNGTIDLRTGELGEHRKEDLITKISPVAYDPTARSDRWTGFLRTITNDDKDLELYLQRAAGYSLLGDNEAEKVFYVLGNAATGKSTFVSAIMSVMGDYAAVADVQSFLRQKNTSLAPRDDLARLEGVRMIVTAETPEGAKLQTALVKQWAGGDLITARPLYGKNIQFRPGVLWMHANHVAQVSADEDAMFRRLRVIPFKHEIPPEKQDPEVKRELCNPKVSGPAILAWLVEGCLMYQRERLGDPPAVKQANRAYREEMNPVADWKNERCELKLGNGDYVETTKDLHDDYLSYCSENGFKYPLSKKAFGKALKAMGLEPKSLGHSNTRAWAGIRLLGASAADETLAAREPGEEPEMGTSDGDEGLSQETQADIRF